jgi:hypothetical protein
MHYAKSATTAFLGKWGNDFLGPWVFQIFRAKLSGSSYTSRLSILTDSYLMMQIGLIFPRYTI